MIFFFKILKPVAITLTYSGLLYLRFQEYSSDERALTKMLLLDIGIGCLFFAILVGGLSAFRDFALSLQFGSNLFCLGRLFCIRRVAFY